MARPSTSRRLCGSDAVFGVLNIGQFSQRHYVVMRRRPAAVARYFRRGPGPAICVDPLLARPIDPELGRDARTIPPPCLRRAAPKRWSAGVRGGDQYSATAANAV